MAEAPKSTPLPTDLIAAARVPNESECIEIVKNHSSALQFKNSLKYIQGGTNMTLDRMIERFDIVLAQIYCAGIQRGFDIARDITKTK